jgi:hypothetical protein
MDELLSSPPAKPDNPEWTARAHVVDDLMRRAAYFALTNDLLACRVCTDAAKQLAADTFTDYDVEFHIRMWAETAKDTPKHSNQVLNLDSTFRLPA